jgi:hypothetical protein
MRHYLTNILTNIYGTKQIVYRVQTFSIVTICINIIQITLSSFVTEQILQLPTCPLQAFPV